jgi:hypothetical protein
VTAEFAYGPDVLRGTGPAGMPVVLDCLRG